MTIDSELAPVCIFAYKRLTELQEATAALVRNALATYTDVYVFVDYPACGTSELRHSEIVRHVQALMGFRSVTVKVAGKHMGLAESVISGVTSVLHRHGRVIVVEDDIVTAENFLDYMNAALAFYAGNTQVFSVSAHTLPLPSLARFVDDVYFGYRGSSWGWGTWLHQWREIDWDLTDYDRFRWSIRRQLKFSRGGSDLLRMLRKHRAAKIDSWAIRWCYAQSALDRVAVLPRVSKVTNIGFGSEATHRSSSSGWNSPLDDSGQKTFCFPIAPTIDPRLAREFRSHYSVRRRLTRSLFDAWQRVQREG